MIVIARMDFIRYHKQVADYLMGLTEQEPPEHELWGEQAAAFVQPQIDYRRGYITAAERVKAEAKLIQKLYPTKEAFLKAFWVDPNKPRSEDYSNDGP